MIRPSGAPLKIKGGRASGKEPFQSLLTFVRAKILARQGKRLTPRDCHDIMCMTGKIVQVGGVRRASEISLSDLCDDDMRTAKTGSWFEASPWLQMSNNSAVYDEKPSAVEFLEEWLTLAKSGSGERGIFNRHAVLKHLPKRRKKMKMGTNPCAEVILRPCGLCNLSITVARHSDTIESLKRKVRLATLWGTLQSCLIDFKYVRPIWNKNCEEERLLGVDITGQMDCHLLSPEHNDRDALLKDLFAVVESTNTIFSNRLGVNRSVALTCIKPSGNSSQFLDCSSGIHARYAKHYIRRVRESRFSPVAEFLRDEGVPFNEDPGDASLWVFEFLVKSPEGAITRNEMTALQMLENWLVWKKSWAEHSVSSTIYIEPSEWVAVGAWVYEHFDDITGVSFLPKDGGTYQLAPYEEISESEYNRRVMEFPKISWQKLRRYENSDMTTTAQELACVGGVCEL
jgi:ribonucleoside-diphosphate reductase alpha chain